MTARLMQTHPSPYPLQGSITHLLKVVVLELICVRTPAYPHTNYPNDDGSICDTHTRAPFFGKGLEESTKVVTRRLGKNPRRLE
jgi:hypothetical protein